MGSTVNEVKKFKKGCIITETIIDGTVFKITEEYRDNKGEVVYIYEYFPTVEENLDAYKKEQKMTHTNGIKDKHKTKVNKKLEKNRKRG